MDKDTAAARLRDMVKPGDTVQTILRHVSRSGMMRSISPVIDGEDVSYLVGPVLGLRFDQKNCGLRVSGCGMDMGFSLVYELSYVLYPEYDCIGEEPVRCPSCDHMNPPRPDMVAGSMRHKDGYALKQRWL